MSRFFSECTSVPECAIDTQAQCDQLKLSGVFNCTEVKHEEDPAVLYCWRLAVENCTNGPVCNFTLSLDPEWKYIGGGSRDTSNTIFQPFFSLLDGKVVNIYTNLPDADVNDDGWTGDGAVGSDENELFTAPVDVPAGRWVVEVCVEVPKSDIETLVDGVPCYDPAMFPGLIEATFTNSDNTGCPVTVTGIVGCSPDAVVAAD